MRRISPDAMPCANREVLVGEKKRRVDEPVEHRGLIEPEVELENERTIDSEVLRVFEETMASRDPPIVRGESSWNAVFDEFVLERLREKSHSSWVRQMRIRGIRLPGESYPDMDEEDEEAGDNVGMQGPAGGEEPDEEGRPVRGPSVPYTPTDKERREHCRTHYPHRAWCEICMGG